MAQQRQFDFAVTKSMRTEAALRRKRLHELIDAAPHPQPETDSESDMETESEHEKEEEEMPVPVAQSSMEPEPESVPVSVGVVPAPSPRLGIDISDLVRMKMLLHGQFIATVERLHNVGEEHEAALFLLQQIAAASLSASLSGARSAVFPPPLAKLLLTPELQLTCQMAQKRARRVRRISKAMALAGMPRKPETLRGEISLV